MMFLNYETIEVHYTVKGKGPDILLLHGFMENLSMWDVFVPQLSAHNRVICVDLLGHGKTGCLSAVHSMEDMAKAVFAVLDQLNSKQIKVVGHSMGGYVALALADIFSNLINDLVLLNSNFVADSTERKVMRTNAAATARENYSSLIRLSFSNLFAPESKVTFKDSYNKALEEALTTPLQGYIAAQEGMKLRPRREEAFLKVKGKRVIIAGRKDGLINLKTLENEIEKSSIELIVFSEGHMSHIENKSELSYFFKRLIEK